MEMTDQTADQAASTPARAIPPLPGGGSWRFDEPSWAWVSTDPTHEAEQTTTEV